MEAAEEVALRVMARGVKVRMGSLRRRLTTAEPTMKSDGVRKTE